MIDSCNCGWRHVNEWPGKNCYSFSIHIFFIINKLNCLCFASQVRQTPTQSLDHFLYYSKTKNAYFFSFPLSQFCELYSLRFFFRIVIFKIKSERFFCDTIKSFTILSFAKLNWKEKNWEEKLWKTCLYFWNLLFYFYLFWLMTI